MKVENLDRLLSKLDKLSKTVGADASKASVTVGFTQNYAVYVHENLEATHTNGQAKFLEQPARQLSNSGELGRLVATAVKGGKTMEYGLLVAGLRIERGARQITPVDTGGLKASAFTSTTSEENQAASDAFDRSQAIRTRKLAARARKAGKSK